MTLRDLSSNDEGGVADPIVSADDKRRYASPDVTLRDRASSEVTAGRYPGGKNGAGVYQRLINQMPPHVTYVEAFLGSGAVIRRKHPAALNVGIDSDPAAIAAFDDGRRGHVRLLCTDAVAWLDGADLDGSALVYCDPPYLASVRSTGSRGLYRHEMLTEEEHLRLLAVLKRSRAMVMVSGYASDLYDRELAGWRRIEFAAMTRGGLATEVVWMNFGEPTALHDYSFLGEDFHDRCRISRKIARWTAKLAALPPLERAAIVEAIGKR